MGHGERAFEYCKQINPITKIDEFEVEPYVFPQNILGDEHPQLGLGRNSWLSGTASWVYSAGTQYILGIRPTFEGLMVDPCIPKVWDGFKVTRQFRGKTYHITVKNPNHQSKGLTSLVVNGSSLEGQIIPLSSKEFNEVEVVLG